ncbi:hypothetical protein SAMN06265222_12141 [Neorhodopirellula lusitana]|uniref:Uncharacterized protein n=1 Tax=Neorhodopirellula lusitana TaxID=445327 RepID=A0ABY1QPN0_9BACT|nr:hypothetical protein SAMN06265222_12141 [Neorhodopirellula lusitana]
MAAFRELRMISKVWADVESSLVIATLDCLCQKVLANNHGLIRFDLLFSRGGPVLATTSF